MARPLKAPLASSSLALSLQLTASGRARVLPGPHRLSALGRLLLKDLGSGKGSASFVQEHAQAATEDGPAPEFTQKLAGLASQGRHPHNAERNLHRFARGWFRSTELYTVPIRTTKGHVQTPFLLPHECLSWLASHPGRLESFVGPPSGLEAYWQSVQEPWVASHWAASPEHRKVAVPVELFGDDAPVWKTEKLLILSWKCVLNTAPTMRSTMLITVLPYDLVLPNGQTLEDLYRVISWSFRAAAEGTWPEVDPQGFPFNAQSGVRFSKKGESLAQGLRLALARCAGDYKFLKETYAIRAYDHTECCHLCEATKTRHPFYTEHSPQAGWRAHPRTHAEYVAERGPSITPLASIPGWHLSTLKCDLLHNVFLGSALRLCGSGLAELRPRGQSRALGPSHGCFQAVGASTPP